MDAAELDCAKLTPALAAQEQSTELFEPDSSLWGRRIRSGWQTIVRQLEPANWAPNRRPIKYEPHEYRQFMKERNQHLVGLSPTASRPAGTGDRGQNDSAALLRGLNSETLLGAVPPAAADPR